MHILAKYNETFSRLMQGVMCSVFNLETVDLYFQ